MSKFTEAKPFEFEGNWVGRRNESGQVVASFRGHTASIFSREGAEFCHAFLEAENNEWHEDGDGFRKGRWLAEITADGRSLLRHVDTGAQVMARQDNIKWGHMNAAEDVLHDFLAWHTANYPKQPAEPTGLGAVVEVPEREPCTPGARERFILTVESGHNPVPWMLAGDPLVRATWGALTDRGPVAVLSEGWTK